jgi:hypothetical protein
MQRAVVSRLGLLESAIAAAVGRPDASVDWRAPLPPNFSEPRDGRVFELLKVGPTRRSLADFWPRRGAVWDGVAVVDDQYVLLEAKAHIPELISGPSKAAGDSLTKIEASLERTRKALAPRSRGEWAQSPFFQYANRLAFLQFLREDNEIPAHLVFVYFTNDSNMKGPESEAEWRGALRLMDASLGIGEHRLCDYVHKLFVDVRSFDVADIEPCAAAEPGR